MVALLFGWDHLHGGRLFCGNTRPPFRRNERLALYGLPGEKAKRGNQEVRLADDGAWSWSAARTVKATAKGKMGDLAPRTPADELAHAGSVSLSVELVTQEWPPIPALPPRGEGRGAAGLPPSSAQRGEGLGMGKFCASTHSISANSIHYPCPSLSTTRISPYTEKAPFIAREATQRNHCKLGRFTAHPTPGIRCAFGAFVPGVRRCRWL